jgi:hypothetical protein
MITREAAIPKCYIDRNHPACILTVSKQLFVLLARGVGIEQIVIHRLVIAG